MQSIGKKSRHPFQIIISLVILISTTQACSQTVQPEPTGVLPLATVITPVLPTAESSSTPFPTSSPTPTPTATATEALPATTPTEIPVETPVETGSVFAFPNPQDFMLEVVADGLEKPVETTHAGDGSGRIFIVEQPGRVRILKDGVLMDGAYLDITERVGSNGSEQGLLGLAFHPDYERNGSFFVNYTDLDGNTVIARFTVLADHPDQVDPDSEKQLLYIRQPYPNHNGGSVVFGPDGYLYLGLGDGGSGGDPQGNGQSTSTLLGKILRIDVNSGDGYAIPADNPFANGGGAPEIWAYGLRNPWRFSFDALTGDMYIGDVGQNAWEEIDFLPAGSAGGANFGWNYREGGHPYDGSVPDGLVLVEPIFDYGHNQGCSVTGGVVYRGQLLPEWQDIYLFSDYCSGSIWGMVRNQAGAWQHAILFDSGGRITSFGMDQDGEVYITGHGGRIFRLARKP